MENLTLIPVVKVETLIMTEGTYWFNIGKRNLTYKVDIGYLVVQGHSGGWGLQTDRHTHTQTDTTIL